MVKPPELFLLRKFKSIAELRRAIASEYKIPQDALDHLDLKELFYYLQKGEHDSAVDWFYHYIYPLIPNDVKVELEEYTVEKKADVIYHEVKELVEKGVIKYEDIPKLLEKLSELEAIREEIKRIREEKGKLTIPTLVKKIKELEEKRRILEAELSKYYRLIPSLHDQIRAFASILFDLVKYVRQLSTVAKKPILQDIEKLQEYFEEQMRLKEEQKLIEDIQAYKRAKIDPHVILTDVLNKIVRAFEINKDVMFMHYYNLYKAQGLEENEAKSKAEQEIKELFKTLHSLVELSAKRELSKALLERLKETLFRMIDLLFYKQDAEYLKKQIRLVLALLK